MDQIVAALNRLERGLDRLEQAIGHSHQRHAAELEASIEDARADARHIAARLDQAIGRLETVLGD